MNAGRVSPLVGSSSSSSFGSPNRPLGDSETLLHAGRIVSNKTAGDRKQVDRVQCLVYGAFRKIEKPPMNFQVFTASQMLVERRRFDQRTDAAQQCFPFRGERPPEQEDLPPVRALEAQYHANCGGFSRSVRPKESVYTLRRNGQAQPAHCDGIPESPPHSSIPHHGVHSISLVDTKEMKEVPAGVLFLGLSRPLCSYAGDDIR